MMLASYVRLERLLKARITVTVVKRRQSEALIMASSTE
jgi:hypothetical protein